MSLNTQTLFATLLVLVLAACGGEESSSGDSNGGADTSNATSGATNNETTATNNGTSSNNNTTSTSNSTTGTSNTTTGGDLCEGVACPDGQMCQDGACVGFEGVGLSVDTNARACELVVLDPANAVREVLFDDAVEGRSLRRGERIAIAFHAGSDAAIDAGSVQFQTLGGQANTLQLAVGRCFDVSGQLIENSILEILQN